MNALIIHFYFQCALMMMNKISTMSGLKVLTETLKNKKNCDSLSSKLNEKEQKLSKLNVRNFDRQMEQKNT